MKPIYNPRTFRNHGSSADLSNSSISSAPQELPPKAGQSAQGICRSWLTWRLIKNQRLRTASIFCGLVLSCLLLGAFASFGCEFWAQVHGEADRSVEYDQTQLILILLITVLLILVAACSAILLHNLYSLTFARQWRSLSRLLELGAGPRDILAITVLENIVLYCAAIPPGCMLTLLSAACVGIQTRPPVWLIGGILLWIWAVLCLCSIRPLWAALHKPSQESVCRRRKSGRTRHGSSKNPPLRSFPGLMTGKYRHANRSHHTRIIMTVLAAILLYVPAGYLIETNISVQRAELDAKYGIQYSHCPQSRAELEKALEECRHLARADQADRSPGQESLPRTGANSDMPHESAEGGTSSLIYVSLSARAFVETDDLSDELRSLLRSAGWSEETSFDTDCTLYFLEDQTYGQYLNRAVSELLQKYNAAPTVLIDRFINRRSWSEDAAPSYQEAPLLNSRKNCSAVEVYYETFGELQWDRTKSLVPHVVTAQLPEGLDFNGDLCLILPLSRLNEFLSSRTDYHRMEIRGKFQDPDDASFSRLEKVLGEDSLGSLRYSRKILQDWYASMSGIRRAMTAICSLLFFIAGLNMFGMMLFQYMERKKGLAILWSLGQSHGELVKILAAEHIRNLLAAVSLGIPLSGLLCYYIYRIFRQVWHIAFTFPLRQTALIVTAACLLSFGAIWVNSLLMRRQDFLKEVSGGDF